MDNLMKLNEKPLVSIIVPVYNTEKFLKSCVTSILNQTYKNIEVILVNDGSTDNSIKIIDQLVKKDSRVKLVNHEKNKGLFQARITGVKAAKGEFLCFVDSDDKISLDWIRLLLNTAIKNDCDIVAGEFCINYDNKNFGYMTLDPLHIKDWDLRDKDVFYEFLKQNYSCYSWHVIWNKLYKKSLWDFKINDLEEFSNKYGKLNMWEDVAFSSTIFSCAKHFMNVKGIYYYYFKGNSNSETAVQNNNIEKSINYINNVYSVMQFFKSQIIKYNCDSIKKEELLMLWEKWNGKVLTQLINDSKNLKNEKIELEIKSKFCNVKPVKIDEGFYIAITPVSYTHFLLEDLISKITSSTIEYVSFDIFDTLLKRTVLKPSDIFEIVSNELNKKFEYKCIDFTTQRINAELQARKEIQYKNPLREEITYDEIYDYFKEKTVFPSEVIEYAKKLELDLEYQFSDTKEIGKYLFDLAIQSNKKIILISDMYLPLEFVKRLLDKNNYNGYTKCYISSEINLTKATGNLYKFVCKDLNIKDKKSIIHIGDNYESDYVNATKKGLNGAHVAKAEDYIFNRNNALHTGNGINKVIFKNKSCVDMRVFNYFLSIRCSLGLMASKFYNKIDCGVNIESDYNADPNKIGYMVLGPHLLAVIEWIKDIVIQEKIPTVHFVARDGYLVKKAFDKIYGTTYCQTNYIRCSRKSLLLADIIKKEDFYNISSKLNYSTLSVKKINNYFLPIIKDGIDVEKIFLNKKINTLKEFDNIESFNKVIKIYIDEIISMDKLHEYQIKLTNYYKQFIKPGDFIFDIGYSGRPEEALSVLLGFPVGSMYIHTNNDVANKRQKMCNIKSFNFYEYKPNITGILREHLFMELGPSVIGFKDDGKKLEPLFEEYEFKYDEFLITSIIQQRAIEFVSDYYSIFQQYLKDLPMRKIDASSLYEDFIHYGTDFDIKVFYCVNFEDDFGMGNTNIYKFMSNERKEVVTQFNVGEAPNILVSEYILENISGKQVIAYKLRHKHNNLFGKFLLFILGLRKY